MAWQRKTPFGYTIQNGEIMRHPDESGAVRDIFSRYLQGESYSRIASEMERLGLRYHQHTPQWNKHMVKRILENERYLGTEEYSRLIADQDFLAVRLQREVQTTYSPCPPELAPIRRRPCVRYAGPK